LTPVAPEGFEEAIKSTIVTHYSTPKMLRQSQTDCGLPYLAEVYESAAVPAKSKASSAMLIPG
jgi:hypothetical protein